MRNVYQTTLSHTAVCAGIGVHSGERARLTLRPAPASTGIVFRRTDAPEGKQEIAGLGTSAYDLTLGTKLQNEHGVTLSTVEHLLSAVYGLGVDNLIIEVDGPEVPIMDGSSALYADLITATGIETLPNLRRFMRITRPIRVEEGPKSAAILPIEGTGFHLDATIDFEKIFRCWSSRKSGTLTPSPMAAVVFRTI